VIGDAFMIASSSPLSPSWRRTPPMCVSSPRDGFVGTMTISLSPYVFVGALRYAGMRTEERVAPSERAIERSGL
jgi:hypothetical protein